MFCCGLCSFWRVFCSCGRCCCDGARASLLHLMTWGPQKFTLKQGPGFPIPRPLAFVLSEFVSLMMSWLCGCWGMGNWPALPLLSLGGLGVEVLLHSILQKTVVWGSRGYWVLQSPTRVSGMRHLPVCISVTLDNP